MLSTLGVGANAKWSGSRLGTSEYSLREGVGIEAWLGVRSLLDYSVIDYRDGWKFTLNHHIPHSVIRDLFLHISL